MSPRPPSRQDDEGLLNWLHLRSRGVSASRIAAMHGLTAGYIRAATNAVKAEDEAHEGRPLAGYWGR